MGSRLVMLVSGLSTSVIVARWLGAEGVGTLSVLNVTAALAVQLGCAGLPSANTYFISKNRQLTPRIWANSLIFGLLAGSVLAIGVIVLTRLSPRAFGDVPIPLVTIAAISIPFLLINLLGLNVFIALGKIDRLNVMDTMGQVVPFLNAVIVLLLIGGSLWSLVLLNTVAAALVTIVVVAMVGRVIGTEVSGDRLKIDKHVFSQVLHYGARFQIAVVAGIVILRADLLLVNNFRGAGEAGVYAVAAQIANLLLLLPAVIATLLFPRVASASDTRGELTMRTTRVTALVMFIICLVAIPGSFLLPVVYGAQFTAATLLLLILIPGVYLLGIEAVLVQHFNAAGLPMAIPWFWILVVCFNLLLNFLFIPIHGALAAAVVSSLSYVLIFSLVAGYFVTKTNSRLSQLFLIRANDISQLLRLYRGNQIQGAATKDSTSRDESV